MRLSYLTLFCNWQVHISLLPKWVVPRLEDAENLYFAKKVAGCNMNEAWAVLEIFRLEMRN